MHDFMERNTSGVCIFCEIAKGTVPASMVLADEHVLAFLSREQPNPYKVLAAQTEGSSEQEHAKEKENRAEASKSIELAGTSANLVYQDYARTASRSPAGCLLARVDPGRAEKAQRHSLVSLDSLPVLVLLCFTELTDRLVSC